MLGNHSLFALFVCHHRLTPPVRMTLHIEPERHKTHQHYMIDYTFPNQTIHNDPVPVLAREEDITHSYILLVQLESVCKQRTLGHMIKLYEFLLHTSGQTCTSLNSFPTRTMIVYH